MIRYCFNFYNFYVFLTLVWIALPFWTNSSHRVFLTTSFFTTSLSLLKPTEVILRLSIPNLSKSDFKLAKLHFLAKLDVSTSTSMYTSTSIRCISNFCEIYNTKNVLQKYNMHRSNLNKQTKEFPRFNCYLSEVVRFP